MFLEILFVIYILLLTISLLYLGTNLIRVRDKFKTHPKIICFMLPFLINYIAAKTIFYDIPPLFSTLMPAICFYFATTRLEKVRVFGLTGGIATGKSTLIKLIKANLDLAVIDCDQISRKLSNKNKPGYKLILRLLGPDKADQYLNPLTKQINREKFSNFVFHNEPFRKTLTREMGKLIIWQIIKDILSNIWNKKNLMIIDAPILYQTKILEYICYPVVVVGCSEEEQIKRLNKRNNYSQQEAQKRIKSQMPLSLKKKKCQVYIENDGTEPELLNAFLKKINRYIDKKDVMSPRLQV